MAKIPEFILSPVEEKDKVIWKKAGELVRCKDCRWFEDIGCAIRIIDDTDKPSEEDYCSFAERKTDELPKMQ